MIGFLEKFFQNISLHEGEVGFSASSVRVSVAHRELCPRNLPGKALMELSRLFTPLAQTCSPSVGNYEQELKGAFVRELERGYSLPQHDESGYILEWLSARTSDTRNVSSEKIGTAIDKTRSVAEDVLSEVEQGKISVKPGHGESLKAALEAFMRNTAPVLSAAPPSNAFEPA